MATSSTDHTALQVLRRVALEKTSVSPYELIRDQDALLSQFVSCFDELKSQGFIEDGKNKIALTHKGREYVQQRSAVTSTMKCGTCQGQGYRVAHQAMKNSLQAQDFLAAFVENTKDRPAPEKEYDQQFISPNDVVLRTAFMDERGDVSGRDILIIGDDDMLSIALGMTKLPHSVVVLEIDERIVEFINQISQAKEIPVRAEVYDARKPIPAAYQKAFDVFVCDPPETLAAVNAFLSRGASSLRGVNSSMYFGLTTQEASTTKWASVQRGLLDMNFAITDIRRNFSEYQCTAFDNSFAVTSHLGENPGSINWYSSAFHRCVAIKAPAPSTLGEVDETTFMVDAERWATPITNAHPSLDVAAITALPRSQLSPRRNVTVAATAGDEKHATDSAETKQQNGNGHSNKKKRKKSSADKDKADSDSDSEKEQVGALVKPYVARHPQLQAFSTEWIHPDLLAFHAEWSSKMASGDGAAEALKVGLKTKGKTLAPGLDVMKHVRELPKDSSIYHFNLFTPQFCKLLIEEAEKCGRWTTETEEFTTVNVMGVEELDDPETTCHLHQMGNLERVYKHISDTYLTPLVESIWKTFRVSRIDRPYVLKYEPDVISEMGLHNDSETVTLVIPLSDPKDYVGGGTYFPKWNFTTGRPVPGTAIVYPGGVGHEHMGLKITGGRRYLLCACFY